MDLPDLELPSPPEFPPLPPLPPLPEQTEVEHPKADPVNVTKGHVLSLPESAETDWPEIRTLTSEPPVTLDSLEKTYPPLDSFPARESLDLPEMIPASREPFEFPQPPEGLPEAASADGGWRALPDLSTPDHPAGEKHESPLSGLSSLAEANESALLSPVVSGRRDSRGDVWQLPESPEPETETFGEIPHLDKWGGGESYDIDSGLGDLTAAEPQSNLTGLLSQIAKGIEKLVDRSNPKPPPAPAPHYLPLK